MNENVFSKPIVKGIASYDNVSDRYFRRRQLQGKTGWFLLWGLGVGAVIGGDFFGWNYGLTAGGFWGLAIATLLMAAMYVCMCYSIAEMSTALPHAGGFYSFTRAAFGPFWGFVCGLSVALEYILTAAAVIIAVSDYLQPLMPGVPAYLIWLFAYIVSAAINIRSGKLSLTVTLIFALIAIMSLVVFYGCMLGAGVFSWDLLFNVPADPGQSETWLPHGWYGVFAAIPYAIWFYLAVEQVPMSAEETRKVSKNLPKGQILAIFTLVVLSFFTLVLNSGVGGGANAIGQSAVPLIDGLEAYFGSGSTSSIITTVVLLVGVIVSFHAEIYGFGRELFALSRAGYLPRWLSVTNKNNTPDRTIILGTAIGFISLVIVAVTGASVVRAALLNMAVFGAVISYILVMASYIKLKLDRPNLARPYQSPLGINGAIAGVVLAVIAFVACFAVPDYRLGLWAILIFLAIAVVYFWIFSRHHLVAQAPEEAASLKGR